MKIVWIKTELLHPVNRGGRIRTYEMLRALSAEHEIVYVTLDDGTAANDAVERATEYASLVQRVPFRTAVRGSPRFYFELAWHVVGSTLPYALYKYRVPELERQIMVAVRAHKPDVVICDFLAPAVNMPRGLSTPTVLFQHNVESFIWERHAHVARSALTRLFFGEQYRRMRNWERRLCAQFDHVIAVSETDAAAFRTQFGVGSVSSVATGVDVAYFAPQAIERRPGSIVFTGAMDWLPNVDGIEWFVRECFPEIRRRHADARLSIVGRDPAPRIQALHDPENGIEVTGTVPDVRPYLAQAAAVVVPLRIGGGTRLKIFEALSMNCPMVSTPIGAEGLPVEHDRHLLLAEHASEFTEALSTLLASPMAAAALGSQGGEHVRAKFSWAGVAADFAAQCWAVARAG